MNQDLHQSRRGFLAKATETAAAIPLASCAAINWNKQDQYNVLDMRQARIDSALATKPGEIQESFDAQQNFMNSASTLESNYRQSYRKSRVVMVPIRSGKTTIMHPQTQHYWDIPSRLPDRSTILEWSSTEQKTGSKVNALRSDSLIDIEMIKRIAIETKNGDDASRKMLTALVYGGSVGMLWGYEEALAFVASKNNGTTYQYERYEKPTATQETRRGFFKFGAAVVGAVAASVVHEKIQGRLNAGQERLQGELDAAAKTAELANQKAISEHFGESIPQTLIRVSRQVAIAEDALLSGAADERVTQSLQEFVQNGTTYMESLTRLNDRALEKAALAYLVKNAMVTKQLESASVADERIATLGALLEGLGIVGVMSLVVVPTHIFNQNNP